MADIYVNSESGDDSAAGGELTPLQDGGYAVAKATANDTVFITASNKFPVRAKLTVAVASVIGGVGVAYLFNAKNVSEGVSRPSLLKHGDLEAWIDADTIYGSDLDINEIAGSTIVQETTDVRAGSSAISLLRTTGTPEFSLLVALPANDTITVGFSHQEFAGGRPRIKIRENLNLGEYYNLTTDAWQAGAIVNDSSVIGAGNSQGSFEDITFTFDTDPTVAQENGNIYAITFLNQTDSLRFILDSLTISAASYPSTYAWTIDTGTTYTIPNVYMDNDTTAALAFFMCTNVKWSSQGTQGLGRMESAANLTACRATNSSWFWDSTTKDLYFNLGNNVNSISDLHIEIAEDGNVIDTTAAATISDLTTLSGTYGAFDNNGDAIFNNVISNHAETSNFRCEGGSVSPLNQCAGNWSYGENNYSFSGAGTKPVCEGCTGYMAKDDGMQSIGGASYIAKGCEMSYAGTEKGSGNQGFGCEGVGSGMELYNVTAAYCWSQGIAAEVDHGTVIIQNSIAAHNNVSGGAGVGDIKVAGAGSVTADSNCILDEQISDYNGLDSNAITDDPLFISETDFNLQESSPCVGVAPDEPGAAAWIVGANGEVFPNVNRDIGGNQSTHSPTHPVNT